LDLKNSLSGYYEIGDVLVSQQILAKVKKVSGIYKVFVFRLMNLLSAKILNSLKRQNG